MWLAAFALSGACILFSRSVLASKAQAFTPFLGGMLLVGVAALIFVMHTIGLGLDHLLGTLIF